MAPLLPYIEAYKNREIAFRFRGREYCFSLSHGLFSSADIDAGSRFLLKIFSNYLDTAFSGTESFDTAFPEKRGEVSLSAQYAGGEFPRGEGFLSVLDAGCGVGVLGICAAGALRDLAAPFRVRCQDRDELARLFTAYNAEKNGLLNDLLTAHAEPLLAGPAGQRWDIILCNIPAKAGLPVLDDFVRRSAGLLTEGGRIFLVAVNTLADFFRSRIAASACLLSEESGKEHTVFVYGKDGSHDSSHRGTGFTEDTEGFAKFANRACPGSNLEAVNGSIVFDERFPQSFPFYIRNHGEYEIEGISYRLDTVHGAADFDSPGGAVAAAAKLAVKIGLAARLAPNIARDSGGSDNGGKGENAPGGAVTRALIHDAGQGHFALWLARYLEAAGVSLNKAGAKKGIDGESSSGHVSIVVSGRNVVALTAARAALLQIGVRSAVVPSSDIFFDAECLGAEISGGAADNSEGKFAFTGFFPEIVPETNRTQAAWDGLARLAAPGGIVITGMGSAESERFDRKKHPAFARLADIKRKGFRAAAYVKAGGQGTRE